MRSFSASFHVHYSFCFVHQLPFKQNKNTLSQDILLIGRKEMFYLMTHSTHFIYGYMAPDIWYMTIQIAREETRCRHIGYSFQLTARVLLYAPSHRQDNTYQGHCYTSRGTRNSSMGHSMKDRSDDPSHHERTLLPRFINRFYICLASTVCFCVT